ncbi:MAG TPA: glycine cleavage T C-terminal barrel domain-containing protein, partial [Gammaproteobacteria bacterium]|nr:glycine cleavage T C-terminal barrel domain-containing protein [Gammaproteobacteria bacterium]
NLAWTVAMDPAGRDFIGRAALERLRAAGEKRRLTGLVLRERGILRHGQSVSTEAGEGIVTSGGFAPTLGRSIALARLPAEAAAEAGVVIRKLKVAAAIVNPPFVRRGKVLVRIA